MLYHRLPLCTWHGRSRVIDFVGIFLRSEVLHDDTDLA
jgi:hypothetical protein